MRSIVVPAWLVLLAIAPALADGVIRLDEPAPYDLQSQGFELERAAEVEIEAVGIGPERGGWWIERLWRDGEDEMGAYAWLLDAETRRPVWTMTYEDSEGLTGDRRRERKVLDLEPGRYELYYFAGHAWAAAMEDEPERDDGSWWERFHDRRRDRENLLEDLASCGVTLSVRGLPDREVRRFDAGGVLPGALISAAGMGDSAYGVYGFELARGAKLRLYGVIEHVEHDRYPADSAWIVDARTREVVFDAGRTRTLRGGGGDKNRLVDTEIALDAGRYLLYVASDDSHSLDGFNVGAPWDPYHWGMTLLPGEGFDAAAFSTFETELPAAAIDLTHARSSRTLQRPFRLAADARLWIHALGEYGDEDFYDRGWIVDGTSGEVVWEMTGGNTRGGGGAAKNRLFDGIVELAAGDYILYYVTDGSHAWEDWNAAAPFRPEDWGVAVRPAPGERLDLVLIEEGEIREAGDLLARLVGVGDGERRGERFDLDTPARVRVYALGEGESGRMYDYAFIRDDSGRHVWEMEYSGTRHAGGAQKNRLIDERIELQAGAYEVVYVSDGSHSAAGWNAGPPRDPVSWGVTVRRVEDL